MNPFFIMNFLRINAINFLSPIYNSQLSPTFQTVATLYVFNTVCKRHGEIFIKQAFDIPWRDVNTIKRCWKACKNQQKDLSFEVRSRKLCRCDGKTNNNSLWKDFRLRSIFFATCGNMFGFYSTRLKILQNIPFIEFHRRSIKSFQKQNEMPMQKWK